MRRASAVTFLPVSVTSTEIHGAVRLEAACQLALSLGTCQYRHVRDILLNNRDRVDPANAEWTSPDHANVRGPGYYQ